MNSLLKTAAALILAAALLAACGNNADDAEEFIASYYALMQNHDYEEMVDYLSDSLLDHMQLDAEMIIEDFENMDLNFDYDIKETVLLDTEEELHAAYEEYEIVLDQIDEDTDIYRIRVELLYNEQGYDYPGIDDALVAEIDGEWRILGVFSYS